MDIRIIHSSRFSVIFLLNPVFDGSFGAVVTESKLVNFQSCVTAVLRLNLPVTVEPALFVLKVLFRDILSDWFT